jgi:hypothetical protein
MIMQWLLIALLAWPVLALAAGMRVGRAVRLSEARDARTRTAPATAPAPGEPGRAGAAPEGTIDEAEESQLSS